MEDHMILFLPGWERPGINSAHILLAQTQSSRPNPTTRKAINAVYPHSEEASGVSKPLDYLPQHLTVSAGPKSWPKKRLKYVICEM